MFGIDINNLDDPDNPEIFLVSPQSEIITPQKNSLYSVAVALPENEVFSKIFEQDTRRSDKEIFQILRAYFSDFNQPLVMDFQRVGKNKILVLVAPEEKVKKLYTQIPPYLKIKAIESEAYAVLRAVKKTEKISGELFGFSYTENNSIKLFVFERNILIYSGPENLFEKFYPDYNSKNIKILKLNNKSYLLALGLALREPIDLNLHPWREQTIQSAHRRGILFVLKAIILSLILSLGVHILWSYWVQKNRPVAQTQAALNSSQKSQISVFQNKLIQLNKLKQQQKPSVILLTNLGHAMPEGVFLTQLEFNNINIKLSGQAVTQTQINALMANLKTNKFFTNPVLNNITADNTEPPYNFKFVISAGGNFYA